MSQSAKTLREFGSLNLFKDLRVKTGSTTTVTVKSSPAPVSLTDADATLTVAQLKSGIFTVTPTSTRTLTLPTATLMAGFLQVIGDSFEFTVVNLGADTKHIVVAAGTGGSVVGYATVRDSDATAAAESGSGVFRVRQTGVDTPSYVVYRIS